MVRSRGLVSRRKRGIRLIGAHCFMKGPTCVRLMANGLESSQCTRGLFGKHTIVWRGGHVNVSGDGRNGVTHK